VYTRTLEEGRTTVLERSLRNKKTWLAVEEKQVVREQGQQVKHQVDSWNLNESEWFVAWLIIFHFYFYFSYFFKHCFYLFSFFKVK
jgi:hypothetical protein